MSEQLIFFTALSCNTIFIIYFVRRHLELKNKTNMLDKN